MDSAKAQEFLGKHGDLIQGMLSSNFRLLQEARDDAIRNGWFTIRKTCQQEMDETIAAMRELELLRGEG